MTNSGNYDLFNGDADGIISLYQYRKWKPSPFAELYTGIKRDVTLLRHLTDVKSGLINVFDISMKTNEGYIPQLINNDNTITWFDHHEMSDDENILASVMHRVDKSPDCCTAMMVDQHVGGQFRSWTICAAYGDNLHESAIKLNDQTNHSSDEMTRLKTIGETLNYNGYGNVESDLTSHPRDVYVDLTAFDCPFDYYNNSHLFVKIKEQMQQDKSALEQSTVVRSSCVGDVILLPDTPSSIRYSGIYSNQLCTDNPSKAFAILTHFDEDSYKISIRAPKDKPYGASTLALKFPSGGGREKAAGVNQLPKKDLPKFIEEFYVNFS